MDINVRKKRPIFFSIYPLSNKLLFKRELATVCYRLGPVLYINVAVCSMQLHRVSVDHLSDAFVDVFSPLNSLVKVAQEGDRGKIEKVAEHFQQHVHTMLKVSNMYTQTC